MQTAISPYQHHQHYSYPQHVPMHDFSTAAASAAEVANDTTADSIPRSYIIDKLRSLSSTYWGDGFTADCWLLIQGHSPNHPPITLLPAHSPYLVACVPTLRDLLAAAGGPINRALNSATAPALPLTVRPPCPEAFPELLRWVYMADISHLRRFLKQWRGGAAAAMLANAAWAGVVDRELRILCEGYMLEEEAKDDAADLAARAKEMMEEGDGDSSSCAAAAPSPSLAVPAEQR
ncbi:hypothetical protein HDU87_004250 [Geranomyces variabilis]|uniref:BTB domain-containing protein n=1 Tax=Geranomyces variabilis TaxID=109894 RepID=A0AAD5TKC0_9FUNG|nr:hypothetical protein HDU87_004250 [Geranomyces variabilis]